MSEMIKRVALALDKKLGDDLESLSLEMGCGSDLSKEMRADTIREAARAAIEAMMVPNDAMLAAVDCAGEKSEWISGRAWKQGYAAMIRAALA